MEKKNSYSQPQHSWDKVLKMMMMMMLFRNMEVKSQESSIPSAIFKDSFEIEEATIKEIQTAFKQNKLTSKQLVEYYLEAIEKLNSTLSAVIEVNPDAQNQAAEADRDRNLPGGLLSGLHGIPVMLKDNISTKDKLNTTAGSFALLRSVVPRDSGVVNRLRKAGAIILGKAGLTEWANYRSSNMKNGWSARGGYVKNPYVSSMDPSGSSTGSAVCVAANLVTVSLGTETSGSIIAPCSCNGVVGIKPTLGLTSRAGVIPITVRQDTVGPIGRTVSDAVYLLDEIVGYDPRDKITKEAMQYIPRGAYKKCLKKDGLNGKRLGSLWYVFKDRYNHVPEVRETFEGLFDVMRQNGAVLLDGLVFPKLNTIMNPEKSGEFLAFKYEFKRDLNAYLSDLLESPIKSLADAITFNENHADQEKLTEFGQDLFIESEKTSLPNSEYTNAVNKLVNLSEQGFETYMKNNNLDAMVVPEDLAYSILGVGGYPGIVIPAGFYPDGLPFGIMFGGLRGSDAALIEIAYALEQLTKVRKPPKL